MDNLDDSENNAKISDSAYSNSCSNSQSRRSHSSKSTHSGSNSSGSSGYGGKPSTSGSSNNIGQQPKKDKEAKKKKQPQAEIIATDEIVEVEVTPPEPLPNFDTPKEEKANVIATPSPVHTQADMGVEHIEVSKSDKTSAKDEVVSCVMPSMNTTTAITALSNSSFCQDYRFDDGFSCVISMHDGIVMYTTNSLTTTLGFPKEMWIGRSFIDFVHSRDRGTFASQITNGIAVPKNENGTQVKAQTLVNPVSTMVCRIRRYRGLASGFGIKDKTVAYLPFLLKLTFKNVSDDEGKIMYLVVQATPFFSAFKTPYESLSNAVPFVIRHAANGTIEYVDPESVPYLGYLPQDLAEKDALMMYHPDDLIYLRHVYEIIVKEGGLPRSKAYRMQTQNGEYIKLETEWSSFINPWSRKLEFVIGKHHIIEGPANPDVFHNKENDKPVKVSEEERNKAQMLREHIIRIMNEVLTKPAEAAKQQMSKRCQDLASFMESLMEDQPKTDEELRLDIQDPDHSYYERDSVMLGGISPHHDYNDSKSSTETPLSYNQLNYNETLQRYFNSHQPYSYEDYNTATGENILSLRDTGSITNHCLSPMAQNSGDSGDLISSSESNLVAMGCNSPVIEDDFQAKRLTEYLLNKHNADMEKELMKTHRESRSNSKGERDKVSNQTRQKKMEHLARCNASFQPTNAHVEPSEHQPHGVKRPSKHVESENLSHKHHCSSQRQSRRTRHRTQSVSTPAQPPPTVTTTVASSHWPTPPMHNNMNTFIVGVGIPPQMSIMNPVPAMTGMIPMYYAPASVAPVMSTTTNPSCSTAPGVPFQPAMMVYGHPMYGQPFVYSPISHPMPHQVPYPMPQTMMAPSMPVQDPPMNPLGLTTSNYKEACKPSITLKPSKSSGGWRDKKWLESRASSSKTILRTAGCTSTKALNRACKPSITLKPSKSSGGWRDKKWLESRASSSKTILRTAGCTSTKALKRESEAHSSQSGNEKSTIFSSDMKSSSNSYSPKSTEAVPNTLLSRPGFIHSNKVNRVGGTSDDAVDKTDGESSYSSFYSSFFKTESGSAEESGDAKKPESKDSRFESPKNKGPSYYEPHEGKKVARRKMQPPWMEQVCVTSELIYKYQVLTKSLDETLNEDRQKIKSLKQPSLVNDQLGQLYLDMQLEGVASRLTLEEGITSSSSSGEETTTKKPKGPRRKREYSKLVMIYEEDAPMPSPDKAPEPDTAESTSSTF